MSKVIAPTKRVLFTANAKLALKRQRFDKAGKATEAADGEEKITLTGYPMIWNALSDDRGGYKVKLLPGSAKFQTPTLALFHHDFQTILGNTANGTLRIAPDDIGVKVEIDLPGTTCAADVAELVEDKYVGGMSFSMLWDGLEYDVKDADQDNEVMEVKAFMCDEVTVTAIPSFLETTIGLQDPDPKAADANMSAAPERAAQAIRLAKLELGMRMI